ncbi:MAG: hypothetical protein K8R21_15885, partial [Leptospira sp.]|nr:hypothetical protein [Leptospira sp.]
MADKKKHQDTSEDMFSELDPDFGSPESSEFDLNSKDESGDSTESDFGLSLDDIPLPDFDDMELESAETEGAPTGEDPSFDDIDNMLGGSTSQESPDHDSEEIEDEDLHPGMEPPSLDDFSSDSLSVDLSGNDSLSDEPLLDMISSSSDESDEDFESEIADSSHFDLADSHEDDLELNLDEEASLAGNEHDTSGLLPEELNLDFDDSLPLVDDELNKIINTNSGEITGGTTLEEDEGPIALSDDELNNILDSDDSMASHESILDSAEDDEPIALSMDELEHITEEEGFEQEEHDDVLGSGTVGLEEDEGPIALSDDELNNILDSDESMDAPGSGSVLDSEDDDEPIA